MDGCEALLIFDLAVTVFKEYLKAASSCIVKRFSAFANQDVNELSKDVQQ